jgi:SagB-type dehydrogenase family enzyme
MPIEAVDLFCADAAAGLDEEPHTLAELFLENSKLRPHEGAARARRISTALAAPGCREALAQPYKCYASSTRLSLPSWQSGSGAGEFERVVRAAAAQSGQLVPVPLALEDLSRLLFHAGGALPAEGGATDGMTRRTVASAGGLHPLELYVLALRVEGLSPGAYHYQVAGHALEALGGGALETFPVQVAALFAPGDAIGAAAAVVVTTAIPLRSAWLLGERGYRVLLFEAGQVAHALRLGAAALGLGARPTHEFYDDEIHRLLELDGVDELVVGVCPVGAPDLSGG